MVSSICPKMYTCNEYATWQVMEEYLPLNIYDQFRKVFNEFDVHASGVINIDHLPLIAARYGQKLTVEEAKSSLHSFIKCDHQCGHEKVNFIDFSEFLAIMMSLYTNVVSEDEIKKVFDIFDQDGDGFISREELKTLLLKLEDEVNEEDIEEMIREADRDGDGLVSYQEFVRIITNSAENEEEKQKSLNWSSSSESIQSSESSSLCKELEEDDDVFIEEKQTHPEYTKNSKPKRKMSIRRSFRKLTRSKTRTLSGQFPMDTLHEEEIDHSIAMNNNVQKINSKCMSLPSNMRYNSKAYLDAYSKEEYKANTFKRKTVHSFARNLIRKSRSLKRSFSLSSR